MRGFQEADCAMVFVTKQSGLVRGYYTEKHRQNLTISKREELGSMHVQLAGIDRCTHHPKVKAPEFANDCMKRNPTAGMVLQATRELGLSLPDCLLINDSQADIEATSAVGINIVYQVKSDSP